MKDFAAIVYYDTLERFAFVRGRAADKDAFVESLGGIHIELVAVTQQGIRHLEEMFIDYYPISYAKSKAQK